MSRLTNDDKAFLLRLARSSIEAALSHTPYALPNLAPLSVSAPRSAFVTLHNSEELRGCVGYVEAPKPLYQTVAETAAAAALNDARFPPVRLSELPQLKIEISVLFDRRVATPKEIAVGLHGLMISQHGRRGLLLPQVAEERGWTREKFLEETCRKAGLARSAWREGAIIEVFTAEVFGEPGAGGS